MQTSHFTNAKLKHYLFLLFVLIFISAGLLLPGVIAPLPASAANYSCDEAGLDQALAAGDPAATFACGSPTTITITSPKVVTQSTSLDGGGLLTISGGDSTRVFSVTAGITLTLNNLIVSYGRVISDSGGAIYNNGTLLVYNSTIANSTASGDAAIEWAGSGGGIYNNGTAIISNSLVTSNTVLPANPIDPQLHHGGHGGGIHNSDLGTLTVIGSTFTNNVAPGPPGGGAILNRNTMLITDSLFIGNSARFGGAVETLLNDYSEQVSINHNTFINNTAEDAGGGLYSANQDTIVTNNYFNENFAYRGGGIFVAGGSGMSIQGNTFYSNTATIEGGAIWSGAGFAGVTLINSTLANNRSSYQGGGIYVDYGDIALTNSTLVGNTAAVTGGNLYVRDFPTNDLILYNSIVANGSPENCGSGITSNGYNLEDGNSCSLTATGDITQTDPLLGPLQDNGGATFTHALLPGSPAINAGDDTACPATDQRGAARLLDVGCDIGAYEAQVPTLTSMNPISATVGGSSFTLIVTGTRFISGAVVLWNGSPRTTTFSDSTHLAASIQSSNLTAGGLITVTVQNPGNFESNGLPFTLEGGSISVFLPIVIKESE